MRSRYLDQRPSRLPRWVPETGSDQKVHVGCQMPEVPRFVPILIGQTMVLTIDEPQAEWMTSGV